MLKIIVRFPKPIEKLHPCPVCGGETQLHLVNEAIMFPFGRMEQHGREFHSAPMVIPSIKTVCECGATGQRFPLILCRRYLEGDALVFDVSEADMQVFGDRITESSGD